MDAAQRGQRGRGPEWPRRGPFLPAGTIFAATYGQWGKDENDSILGYRFNIEQLDELAKKEVAAE